MKGLSTALSFLLFASTSLSYAQYFSAGWTPGQPVKGTTPAASAVFSAPQPTRTGGIKALYENFHVEDLLTAGPIATALAGFGVNLTSRVEAAKKSADVPQFGYSDIPMISDKNFGEIIEEERFHDLKDESERVWFLVVTIGLQDPLSEFVDTQFNKAYNLTVEAGDLHNVRWGRIDYMNVTELTTRWLIWRAPAIVVLRNRGQDLRFFKPRQDINVQPQAIREFLRTQTWKNFPPWTGIWSPVGIRGPWLRIIGKYQAKFYNFIVKVPRWALLVITGSIGSAFVNYMHKTPAAPKPSEKITAPPSTSREADPPSPAVVVTDEKGKEKKVQNAGKGSRGRKRK